MSTETNTPAVQLVKRTNTSDNLTIRETTILLFLLGKAVDSTPPTNFEDSPESLRDAFGVIGRYAVKSIQEARAAIPVLQVLANSGDESAEKQLAQAQKALADVTKQQRAGKLDRLMRAALPRVAAKRAEAPTAEVELEASESNDDEESFDEDAIVTVDEDGEVVEND